MNTKEIHEWLRSKVDSVVEERGISRSRAFAAWLLSVVHEIDDDQAIAATDTLVGFGGGDGGIDGFFRDDEELTFHIWQCKWSDDPAKKFDKSCGIELIDALLVLLDASQAKKVGTKFANVADELKHAMDRRYSLSLNIGIPTQLPNKSIEAIRSRLKELNEQYQSEFSISVYDAETLHALDRDRNPDTQTLEGQEVEFQLSNEERMELGDDNGLPNGWRAIVSNVLAVSLGRRLKEYGSRMFSLNVRYALSRRLKRVDRIHKTLTDDEASPFFWFYNNGITVLADRCEVIKKSDGTFSLVVQNPQIVNGCQTVSSFEYQLGRFSESVAVLVRVIVPPSGPDGKEQARLISENTNTQSPVSARDLRTNDPIHQDIAARMNRQSPKWYYEIKRGQWDKNAVENRRLYGDRQIDMERLAQTFLMQFSPADALTKKKSIFEDQLQYEFVFKSGRSVADFLFPEIARRYFEALWHKSRHEKIRNLCGDHMEDEVINLLLTAKGQVVSHSVALTSRLFEVGGMWSEESASTAFKILSSPTSSLDPWMMTLGKGLCNFYESVLKESEKEGREISLKKQFERSEKKSFHDLWKEINAGAGLWLGKQWHSKVIKQIADGGTQDA